MRKLYIDSDFKLHTTNAEGRTSIETDAFDGMSDFIIECYIFIPKGKSYTKPNGIKVHGEFIQPFVSEKELDAAQREFERAQLAEYKKELAELDAALLDAQYQNIIGGM